MLRSLLVISLLGAGVVGGLFSRYLALLGYVWFAMFRPQEWMWWDISALRPSLVLGIVLAVPSLVTGVFPNLSHPISLGSIAFLFISFVSQFTAVSPELGWPALDAQARLVAVVLFAISILNSRERIIGFVAVAAGSFGFHTAKAGLASVLGGGVRFAAGLGGAFADNNGYALGAVMIAPLLLATFLVLRNGDGLRPTIARGFLIAVPFTGLMIVGTMSRGALVALAAATAVFIALQRRRLRLAVCVAIFLAIGVPFVPAPEGYGERMQTITTYDEVEDGSALGRLHFWRVARVMATENLLGVGLGGYNAAYDRYDLSGGQYGHDRSVHSSHFQVLAELGYGGAVVWIGLLALTYLVAFKAKRFAADSRLGPEAATFYRVMADAVIVSTTAFVVGGAFLAASRNDVTWYTFALAAALDRLRAAEAARLAEQARSAAPPVRVNVPPPRVAARHKATA
jgi:putative inorganic carbon (HCO3(-)) transporter